MTVTKSQSYCHSCRAQRVYFNGLCMSCGSPESESYEPVKRESAGVICPGCQSLENIPLAGSQFRCTDCGSRFELPDNDAGIFGLDPLKTAQQNEARRRHAGRT